MDDRNREYSNDEITVFWRPGKCIHSSVCYTKLLEVFNPIKRPWVNMNGAPTDKIIEVINKCPTEALMWKWNDEKRNEKVTQADTNHIKIRRPYDYYEYRNEQKKYELKPVKVRVMKNGPLVVEGSFNIINYDGENIKSADFTSLCRCGQSNSVPFCDGMHRKAGFEG